MDNVKQLTRSDTPTLEKLDDQNSAESRSWNNIIEYNNNIERTLLF